MTSDLPSLLVHGLPRHCFTRTFELLVVFGAHRHLVPTAFPSFPVGSSFRFGHVPLTLDADVVARDALFCAAEPTNQGFGHFHLVLLLSHVMADVTRIRFGTAGEPEIAEGVFIVLALAIVRERLA